MASADSRQPIPAPCDASSTRQTDGAPRVMRATFLLMPVGSTSWRSVQVLGFTDLGLLTPPHRLISASCSSGQHFACGFLQIPPYDGHPCRSASTSPCRVCRGLSPPSHPARHHSGSDSASHGATRHAWRTKQKGQRELPFFVACACAPAGSHAARSLQPEGARRAFATLCYSLCIDVAGRYRP
ncbi:hypothetical protein SAMN05445850_3233 [Paraburkholderia tuberum]|uniref:Uncharacterized protein n=1 Tax=Paraburkholderia tuberum TaxID=157910 RepID=A0A1H1H2K0_9BURK|nr:hypothetical protein SAMN05445850_3233 [Paraburkholderia tuberum]